MREHVDGHEVADLTDWEVAACPPDAHASPSTIDGLAWVTAAVPGTAAGALRDAGLWSVGDERDLDAEDFWFRTRADAAPPGPGEELVLVCDGIATVSEVFLDGTPILTGESMFAAHEVPVAGGGELAIRCRALRPLLAETRKPRARWRTKVAERNLRFFRTTILGRAPGFAPSPAAVGPWRPVRLERRRRVVVDELALRPRVEGADGVLAAAVRLRALGDAALGAVTLRLTGPSGEHEAELAVTDGVARGELRVPSVARWWPHTHGEPTLHDVSLRVEVGGAEVAVTGRHVGFRALETGPDPADDGLALRVNGVDVFARGAVWTPPDPVGLAAGPDELRAQLAAARDAGMNTVRLVGTAGYESDAFHDLCDELGLLLWQDLAFANFDYPIADPGFRTLVEDEVRAVAARLAGRPSLAVVCGNSEVEQQVAMLGLDPALGRGELFGELVPRLLAEARLDAAYIPSSPCGGALPFRPDRGVAHYFGVGAYRRGLDDARRAAPRFVSECLAFANVGDDDHEAGPGAPGVPRDAGVDWDFADVRDHYLAELFGLDPVDLRFTDPDRYLSLSREVSGEVMAEVLGEWRRAGSPCAGALVLWLRDLVPGAGWGVLDRAGVPKVAYHHLRRALAPVAVWTTNEGLGGIRVHVANDRPLPLAASLRVTLYADGERVVEEGAVDLALPPHATAEHDAEAVLGRFADVASAYRFGPPAHDAVAVALERGDELLGHAVRFPSGRPVASPDADDLGLAAELSSAGPGRWRLRTTCRRLAYGVRIHTPGLRCSDDAFTLEPRRERVVELSGPTAPDGATLTALNLRGAVPITVVG